MGERNLGAFIAAAGLAAFLSGCAIPADDPLPSLDYNITDCADRVVVLPIRGPGGGNAIFTMPGERSAIFKAGMVIDADGAPEAFHPSDENLALDSLAHAGRPGQWWSLATDKYGRPFVQDESDMAPGFYVSKTALFNPEISDQSDPGRYVDAQTIPYIALPDGAAARRAFDGIGLKLGDLVAVYSQRNGAVVMGLYADTSRSDLLGEASMALADELGYPSSPKTDSVATAEFLYLVFPGTSEGWPRSVDSIRDEAARMFHAWGGRERMKTCAAQM